jgi:tRNA-Thr(GGU) m(6)t(6)A37 methyltransferase TsaA
LLEGAADGFVRLTPIGHVVTGFDTPGDVPAQATEACHERGRVVVYERFRDGMLGLDRCAHVWLLTWLHVQDGAKLLQVVPRVARLGEGERHGVFATRAPWRPNQLGLSLVQVTDVTAAELFFRGVDLVSGTPVLDIKPWSRGTDTPVECGVES